MCCAIVLAGSAWAWRRVRLTNFFYDEWSMIWRIYNFRPIEGAITSFNGHLWFFQDAIYRVQIRGFGLESNRFLVVVFLVSLVALHLALAAVACRIGLPPVPALLFGGLLTYLGGASQNFMFAIQVSPTFATAAAVATAAVVLGRPSTVRRTIAAATLLLLSVLFDSAFGLLALALGGGLIVQLWPRSRWWAIVPGLSVAGVWYALVDVGADYQASFGDRLSFAAELVVRSAGVLVGGGVASGVVVLGAGAAVLVSALRGGHLTSEGRALTVAGFAGTLVLAAGIAQSRAGLPGFSFFEGNRYLQNVAIPLSLALLPAFLVAARAAVSVAVDRESRERTALAILVSAVLIVAFAFGLDDERDYAEVFLIRAEAVEAGVADTVVLTERGCPSGRQPEFGMRPLGELSPQITTQLIAQVYLSGALDEPEDVQREVSRSVLAAICPP